MLMNTRDEFGMIARLLHWLIFALVIGMLMGGASLFFLPSGGFRIFVLAIHKSIGQIIFLLMVVRLAWRLYNPLPRELSGTPVLNYAAHVLHIVLYVLLLLQPLVGILMSQAFGAPVSFFGLFQLPALVWHSPSLGSFLQEVHGVTAVLLTLAIAVHGAAALKHHFIDHDRTLMRMIKGR